MSNYPAGVTGSERVFEEVPETAYCQECGEFDEELVKHGLCPACSNGPCEFVIHRAGATPQPCGRRGVRLRVGCLCLDHQRSMKLDVGSLHLAAEQELGRRRQMGRRR